MEELDLASSPSLFVSGAKRKQVWYDMRGSFTQVLKNFKNSGENNRTLSRFVDFLEMKPNGEFYAISKLLLVMFVVMRIGTDIPGEEVRNMVDLTTRKIPNNVGFDVAAISEEGDSSADGSEGTSKKRQEAKEACVDTRLLYETIKALTDSLSGRPLQILSYGRDKNFHLQACRPRLLSL